MYESEATCVVRHVSSLKDTAMKKTSLMLLLLAGSFCLPVAAENKQDACKILDLKRVSSQLNLNPQSKEKQMAFLEAFPNSWEEFPL